MNDASAHIILQVERAASDLRRGQSVLLLSKKGNFVVTAGEYKEEEKAVTDSSHPAVRLMKLAGLLPRAVITQEKEGNADLLGVTEDAITEYPAALAASLGKVSEASVPLQTAEKARVIAFRPRFGHQEHLAIVVGNPAKNDAPYVRLHSSCITGDVLGSLRCDCGTQLQKSLEMINRHKDGAIIYLSQEGRGISIANKLRAYELQDQGMDTVEANEKLGFLADERDYAVAAEMLRQLGLTRIVLITNNPAKIKALAAHGIEVVRREPVIAETTAYNTKYLDAKALKMGHHLKEQNES